MTGSAVPTTSAAELYKQVFTNFNVLESSTANPRESAYQDQVVTTIQQGQQLLQEIANQNILSKNEFIDEMKLDQIPYIFIEYYLAILHQELDTATQPNERIQALEAADACFSAFLDKCELYMILSERDRQKHIQVVEHGTDADSKRVQKIKRFKAERAAKQQIQQIILEQEKLNKQPNDSLDNEREDLERQRLLKLLDLAIFRAMDEQLQIAQEVQMLKQIVEMQAAAGPLPLPPREIPQGQGIEVTHIGPTFEMRKEVIRSKVFTPGHRLPTMSLQEYADRELADAKERQKREAEAPKAPRRIEQLEADGDEDDNELVEEAAYRDRSWDDWKDANPRGAGNKGKNQF